jgi:hypothetical protein
MEFSVPVFWVWSFIPRLRVCCVCSSDVSKAYQRIRDTKDSKRVIAINVLANRVWPFISVIVAIVACVHAIQLA